MVSRLIEKIQKTKAPICVGLDPMLSYIPEHVTKKAYDEFGETLEGAAQAIWLFNKEIIDATADLIPSVKPQIAMYEQFGIEGLKAYDTDGYNAASRRALLSLAMLSAEISAPLPLLMQPAISARCRWEVMFLQVLIRNILR